MAPSGSGEGDGIVTRIGVGVADVCSCSCLSIAEVPCDTTNLLTTRIGGGGAGELSGFTFTNGGVGEVGSDLRINLNSCGSVVGLGAHMDGASVVAAHGRGAVGTGYRLSASSPSAWTRPSIGGS